MVNVFVFHQSGHGDGNSMAKAALATSRLEPAFSLKLNGSIQRDKRPYTNAQSLIHGM